MSNTFLSIGHMVFPFGLAMFLFVVNAKYGMHAQARQSEMERGVVTPMAGAVFGPREMSGVIVLMTPAIAGVTGCCPPTDLDRSSRDHSKDSISQPS